MQWTEKILLCSCWKCGNVHDVKLAAGSEATFSQSMLGNTQSARSFFSSLWPSAINFCRWPPLTFPSLVMSRRLNAAAAVIYGDTAWIYKATVCVSHTSETAGNISTLPRGVNAEAAHEASQLTSLPPPSATKLYKCRAKKTTGYRKTDGKITCKTKLNYLLI